MDSENADALESRPPGPDDLIKLCDHLNKAEAKYLIVGGFAVIQQGLYRTTEDIDVLLESSMENQQRVRKAMEYLPDKAILEVKESDLNEYLVVRVADEIVVDLMLSACGVDYQQAESEIEWHDLRGVRAPFASAPLLLRLKQTYREKDALDRQFLAEKLRKGGK
jgi:hypothetical protein